MSDVQYGTVKFYSTDKSYGFIIPDAGGEDMFVHRTGLATVTDKDAVGEFILLADQRVSYTVVPSDRKKGNGFMAANVEVVVTPVSALVATG